MMTLFPITILPLDAAKVAGKAAHLAQVDPHGFIITIVSVSVVFTALIVLFLSYSFIGKICTGAVKCWFIDTFRRKRKAAEPDSDTAAAIALALELSLDNDEEQTAAAISLALDRYLNEYIHDTESYVITIRRNK